MLKPYKIADYISEYKPEWACAMPDGCTDRRSLKQQGSRSGASVHDGDVI